MNFKTTVEREKEEFAKLYPPVTIGYDGNETDYFRREKFLEILEKAMTNVALAVIDDFTEAMLADMNANTPPELKELNEAFAEGVRHYKTKYKASLTTKE